MIEKTPPGSRSNATRLALIEAAESMFGRLGIEGVSLRQIGQAVGSANPSVVLYHFGSKDALIKAIYKYRLPIIDRRRGQLLEIELGKSGPLGPKSLMRVLWQPLFEQTDSEGHHSYALFLSNAIRSGYGSSRRLVAEDFPNSEEILQRLRASLTPDVLASFDRRWPLISQLMLTSIALVDLQPKSDDVGVDEALEDAVTMASAALMADLPLLNGE